MKRTLSLPRVSIAAVVAGGLAFGCGDTAAPPTQPSTLPSPVSASPTPAPPSPGAPTWLTGSFTWTSIVASRSICSELTGQVGGSWPLSLGVQRDGDSVTLLIAEGPPPDPRDPLADPAEKFVGTQKGDTITAAIQDPNAAMGCPADAAPTPETGGSLTAVVAGEKISGTYTEVYGSGAGEVTFTYAFNASSSTATSRR